MPLPASPSLWTTPEGGGGRREGRKRERREGKGGGGRRDGGRRDRGRRDGGRRDRGREAGEGRGQNGRRWGWERGVRSAGEGMGTRRDRRVTSEGRVIHTCNTCVHESYNHTCIYDGTMFMSTYRLHPCPQDRVVLAWSQDWGQSRQASACADHPPHLPPSVGPWYYSTEVYMYRHHVHVAHVVHRLDRGKKVSQYISLSTEDELLHTYSEFE